MLKILSSVQIKEADAFTIIHEPVFAVDLMERAATAAASWILNHYAQKDCYHVFCGPGNNGGDGLVIARLLFLSGKKVQVYIYNQENKHSEEYEQNLTKLNVLFTPVVITDDINFNITNNDIVIDALFGTGLTRPVEGIFESTIKSLNSTEAVIISIDIPSGMMTDEFSPGKMIKATHTVTFQFPKFAFLFPETGRFAGNIHIVNIGLHPEYIKQVPVNNLMVEFNDVKQIIKIRQPFSHKGTYGHALIIAGSKGKTGAAVLAASACINSGAGKVTACIPSCCETAINITVPEVMTETSGELYISALPDISNYTSVACGPGIGTGEETARMLKILIQNCRTPLVLDADALNILSENKTWLSFLPPGSILTPHPGEFTRLAGKSSDGFERYHLQKEFSKKYNCYVVLKDHYTSISAPNGTCYFNSTGNAGMATAGSGDVLTGLLIALLVQSYHPLHAAIAGVYIHGLAGDISAAENSMEAVTASSIIGNFGKAFLQLQKSNDSEQN
ncbi:MAG: NAD(P)H-hydrate dehydratase [Bacteroidota bacterium]